MEIEIKTILNDLRYARINVDRATNLMKYCFLTRCVTFIPDEKFDLDKINQEICDEFETTIEEIKGKSQKRNVVMARQLIAYFDYNKTLQQRANFSKRCHATVKHSVNVVENLHRTSGTYREIFNRIKLKIINAGKEV